MDDENRTEVFMLNVWMACRFEFAQDGSLVFIFVDGDQTSRLVVNVFNLHRIQGGGFPGELRVHLTECEPRLTRIIESHSQGIKWFYPVRVPGNQELMRLLNRH